VLAPQREPEVPYLDFAPLDNAVAHLGRSARAYDEAYARLVSSGGSLSDAERGQLNGTLRALEQSLTDARGLPGRPWYRHLIYAPGVLTGYGVKTLPGVREAIEQHRYAEANEYVAITAHAIDTYAEHLEAATLLLRR
jgi:N-acetylated-alpha-linked acidic dipeptidase